MTTITSGFTRDLGLVKPNLYGGGNVRDDYTVLAGKLSHKEYASMQMQYGLSTRFAGFQTHGEALSRRLHSNPKSSHLEDQLFGGGKRPSSSSLATHADLN
jgi:hypothetical protein